MKFTPSNTYFTVGSELVVTGTNPENASPDNPAIFHHDNLFIPL